MVDDGAYGGMVTVALNDTGRWRVSASEHFWFDLVAPDGRLVPSAAFAGRDECKVLNKLVEYEITAPGRYTLQFSGGTTPTLAMLVRRLP